MVCNQTRPSVRCSCRRPSSCRTCFVCVTEAYHERPERCATAEIGHEQKFSRIARHWCGTRATCESSPVPMRRRFNVARQEAQENAPRDPAVSPGHPRMTQRSLQPSLSQKMLTDDGNDVEPTVGKREKRRMIQRQIKEAEDVIATAAARSSLAYFKDPIEQRIADLNRQLIDWEPLKLQVTQAQKAVEVNKAQDARSLGYCDESKRPRDASCKSCLPGKTIWTKIWTETTNSDLQDPQGAPRLL